MPTKMCLACGKTKYFRDFPIWKNSKDGLKVVCKTCHEKFNSIRGTKEYRVWMVFVGFQVNAIYRKIAFDLTFEEVQKLVENPCHYCGYSEDLVGIDRMDSDLGYMIENCVSCCGLCNRMKMASPMRLFIDQCRKISRQHELK